MTCVVRKTACVCNTNASDIALIVPPARQLSKFSNTDTTRQYWQRKTKKHSFTGCTATRRASASGSSSCSRARASASASSGPSRGASSRRS